RDEPAPVRLRSGAPLRRIARRAARLRRAREPPRSCSEWQLDVQRCAGAAGAVQGEGAAQGLDAILQPDQAGAAARVGAAGAVVADAQAEGVIARAQRDV